MDPLSSARSPLESPAAHRNIAVSSVSTPLIPRHVWLHVISIPLALALLGWFASSSSLDRSTSDFFYDSLSASFPAHDNFLLELFGHRIAKAAIWIVALGLLGTAIGARRVLHRSDERNAPWVALAAMALGPAIVYLLKQTTGHHCPWDLTRYGGFAEYSPHWFVTAANAGHCFPSGHASAGYSLIALSFLGHVLDRPRLAQHGLIAAIGVGTVFSLVRVAQGAHFVSHNLWSAAIDWGAAAIVFTPLMVRGRR